MMIRTLILSSAMCAIIFVSSAVADECSDAKNALRISSQNSDRNTKRAQAKIDAIPCCSAAYWQASCDYQKLFLEDTKKQGSLARDVTLACEKRDLSDAARKMDQEFLAQIEDKMRSDCKSAEESGKRR